MKVNIRIDGEGKVYVICALHIGRYLLNRNNKPNSYECLDIEKRRISYNLDGAFVKSLKPINNQTAKDTIMRLRENGWYIDGITRLNCVSRIW